MNASWWLALIAVFALALIASLVDGRGRSPRPPRGRRRPPGAPGAPAGPGRAPLGKRLPQAGEIWWADVPYEDGTGSKDRPCLVLSVRDGRARVAKITTKYRDDQRHVVVLPPDVVGDAHGRASFLETDELRDVRLGEFRRRVGVVDPVIWDRVRHLTG